MSGDECDMTIVVNKHGCKSQKWCEMAHASTWQESYMNIRNFRHGFCRSWMLSSLPLRGLSPQFKSMYIYMKEKKIYTLTL
ncbi:hypothetical protein Lal_00030553 [Lupinus albus]|nr:hypothetical protein Lal_00030553 [Lupinus albus]